MEKMSSGNLIILGLLLDHPMSAYDMAYIIDTQVVGRLVKISAPTVYKNIKKLHEAGYLSMEVVKQGEMPEKKMYTVTDTGKAYFLKLMRYFAEQPAEHHFEFNAVLTNIDKVDKETGLELLEHLKAYFCGAKEWMAQHEQEARARNVYFGGRAIIKQYRMLFTMLVEWINEVIEEYQQTEELGKYRIDKKITRHPERE